MSRVTHRDLLTHADVQRFVEVAREFCDLTERIDTLPKVYFLERLDELLPLVYSLAQRVPDAIDWDADWELDPKDRPVGIAGAEYLARWDELRERIGQKLEPHRWFRFVYDPVDPSDQQVIQGDLADLLADVYLHVKDGLLLYERPGDDERAQAVWNWRFGVRRLWGHKAAQVILPIHMLLRQHYDEDDEVFDI